MAKKKRSQQAPKPKDRHHKEKGFTIELPDAPPPRKGHQEHRSGAGYHKQDKGRGKERQKGKADMKKGIFPE